MYCVLKYSISVYMNMLPCLSCTSPTGVNDFLRYPVVLIIYILTLVACEETASSLNVYKASQAGLLRGTPASSCMCSNTGSIWDSPYCTSGKNSLEIIN